MDKVQKHNSFNTNTPSSESYKNYSRQSYEIISSYVTTVLLSCPIRLLYELLSYGIICFFFCYVSSMIWLLGDRNRSCIAKTIYMHLCFVARQPFLHKVITLRRHGGK